MNPDYDLLIIGGGINGCGIARDAAGRGYSVFLAEMNDLASATSSASTKLIHGGLRYLEHYEFRLVREALKEREVLWAMAPHIIWPLRFVLPHHKGLRPAWFLRLGLFLYDHIGGRGRLPGTATLDLAKDPLGATLRPGHAKAFEYSDCWVDDARLVVLNARDAAARGAVIRTRLKIVSATRRSGHWKVELTDTVTGKAETITARMLVNAAGPWVDTALAGSADEKDVHRVRLVKGSHIVVPKLHDDPRCFFFQNGDGRIFFAIPYEREFTLIGTTDEDYAGDPHEVAISEAEIGYLLDALNGYFKNPIEKSDIVWTYAGVRPLYDDGASKAQETSRDYVLKRTGGDDEPALLTVIGGKITTYRRLAESVLEHVEAVLGERGGKWTAGSRLPGGDFPVDGYDEQNAALSRDYPFLEPANAARLVRRYGTEARAILGDARSTADLGADFGAGLYGAEVRYLMAHEWARDVEDVLWRRTKMGLRQVDKPALAAFMQAGDRRED